MKISPKAVNNLSAALAVVSGTCLLLSTVLVLNAVRSPVGPGVLIEAGTIWTAFLLLTVGFTAIATAREWGQWVLLGALLLLAAPMIVRRIG